MYENARCEFQLRVFLDQESVHSTHVWVAELLPTKIDLGRRSATEWVEEFLDGCIDREFYLDEIRRDLKPDQQIDEEGCFQLLIKGSLQGTWDYFGEYDEDIEFFSVEWAEVPSEYFEEYHGQMSLLREPSHENPCLVEGQAPEAS